MPTLLSRKKLQSYLQDVESFSNPKMEFEQYSTSAEVAADILFNMQMVDGSLQNKTVVDLGCGSGILSIGAHLLGASNVLAFEIDPDAVHDFCTNLKECDLAGEPIDIALCDVIGMWRNNTRQMADTVILNPPFGTNPKKNGVDIEFLKTALSMAKSHVYSMHKSTTRDYVLRVLKTMGANAEVVAELRFDIPRMYKQHRHDSVDIEVDFVHAWF